MAIKKQARREAIPEGHWRDTTIVYLDEPIDTSFLDATDRKILEALDKANRVLMLIEIPCERKTCSSRIKRKLEPKGLVKRVGKRGGIAITREGKSAWKQMRPH